ncbi:hypothetical protein D9C73_008993 [Collichthys lucidus]|uniref:Uncharacterized protein n=1 Tax=Collichthys lucidus TaxID=240159 RepID=A0A4U5UKZ8_COLLU|nr:hypothetical protein D9C73_008993 [Collichthys lucidus]
MAADEKGMKRSGRDKETGGEMAERGRASGEIGGGMWMEDEKMYRGKEREMEEEEEAEGGHSIASSVICETS